MCELDRTDHILATAEHQASCASPARLCRLILMRGVAAILTGLALMAAFLLAPFEHVHSGYGHHDHGHSAIIHAHFHIHAGMALAALSDHSGVRLVAPDGEDASALNIFTSVAPIVVSLVFLPQTAIAVLAPTESFHHVDFVEARGHDPPRCKRSIPRAPPS